MDEETNIIEEVAEEQNTEAIQDEKLDSGDNTSQPVEEPPAE